MCCKKLIPGFLFLFFALTNAVIAQQPTAQLPVTKNPFVIVAQSCSNFLNPENTLAALQEAIEMKVDYIEVNLRTTKDGQIILCNDETVDRVTNGHGRVNELTLVEIKELDVKSKTKKTFTIPTLAEALATCKNRINLFIDFKDVNAEETYKQIQIHGMEKNVVLSLSKADHYMRWRKLAPAIPLAVSLPDMIHSKEDFMVLSERMQFQTIDNPADTAMANVMYQNGVHVWQNVAGENENEAVWKAAMSKGVQGLHTSHPKELIKYLRQNKLLDGTTSLKVLYPKAEVPNYKKLLNVKYSLNYDEDVMDVFFPEKYTNAKVILYIHGGGWTGGDKEEFPKYLLDELVGKKGYVVASMNYRLIKDGKNRFPSQMEDVTSAIQFLTFAAKKYNLNAHEFALMGGSAGGQMAMLYAYGYDTKKQIRTVVDYWGPTDFADKIVWVPGTATQSTAANLVGVTDGTAKIVFDASPYYRITKESAVPTILFHGGDDPLVPVSQADKMHKRLIELGVPTEYYMYPGEKHGVGGAWRTDLFTKTIAWLNKYFPAF
jgi:glycerophosphoryl diester phosphodiesterase